MPAERAPMRKVREVLRLRHALGLSERQIAVSVGVSRSTVAEYLRRAGVVGITWGVARTTEPSGSGGRCALAGLLHSRRTYAGYRGHRVEFSSET